MPRVRPGVELVRATLLPSKELMTLDLPTLERPRKAISGGPGTGKWATSVAAATNWAKTFTLTVCWFGALLASGLDTNTAAEGNASDRGCPTFARTHHRLTPP